MNKTESSKTFNFREKYTWLKLNVLIVAKTNPFIVIIITIIIIFEEEEEEEENCSVPKNEPVGRVTKTAARV